MVSSILNEEYLNQSILKRNNQKENDKVKKTIKDNIKTVIEKIKFKKTNKSEVDPKMITSVLDQQEVAIELEQDISKKIDKIEKDKVDNKEFINKVEKEISMINSEIEKINERKKKSIYDAMEVGEKTLTTTIRKPKMFKKITRFFVSRFNTSKVIETTIIEPLITRIENFKNNELESMQG